MWVFVIIYIKYQIDLHKKHKCKDTLFIVGVQYRPLSAPILWIYLGGYRPFAYKIIQKHFKKVLSESLLFLILALI